MHRKFSPIRSDEKLIYSHDDKVVTITHIATDDTETVDSFDFSDFPDGQAVISEIETTLPINPFISIKRVNSILVLQLINFIGAGATDEEKYPEWEEI